MDPTFDIFNGKRAQPIIVIPDKDEELLHRAVKPKTATYVGFDSDSDGHSDNEREARLVRQELPVHHAPVRDDTNYRLLSPQQRADIFWQIINTFQWRNASDGRVNARAIQNSIRDFTQSKLDLFKEEYNELYKLMQIKLEEDGMFRRNGIVHPVAQAGIISHAIAMGKDQFYTLFDDPEFFQFFIETGECQSLSAILPEVLGN